MQPPRVAAKEASRAVAPPALRRVGHSLSAESRLAIARNALELLVKGRQIFRFDTFGDEAFWGDQLQLHQAIKGARRIIDIAPHR
jgi:hypothetical protein